MMSGAKIIEGLHQAVEYELRQHIAELEAERDEARHQYARVEVQATEYHNRMHDAIARAEEAESAIAELQKRIGELEAVKKLDIRERSQFAYALEVYNAERQRREDCEAALREVETAGDRYMARQSAATYFAKYPDSDNRMKVAG